MGNTVIAFVVSGGGVAVAAGLYKIGNMLGILNATLESLSDRVSKLEDHLAK